MPRPIDADALYDALYDNEFQTFCPLDEVSGVIAAAPTLDYEPVRHGYWICQDNTYIRFMCSVCELKNYPIKYSYCPNCGAKMDAKEDAHV